MDLAVERTNSGRSDAGSAVSSKFEEEQIEKEITLSVLNKYMKNWRQAGHKHLTFRADVFQLTSLDGLCESPMDMTGRRDGAIDLSRLESLDVSCNKLEDLACIEGKSLKLAKLGSIQGTLRFSSLRILKARHNQIRSFSAVLPCLRELDLAWNQLTALPPCSGLSKLEVLVLGHNLMTGHWQTLTLCDSLKKLDLSHNEFDFKPSELGKQLDLLAEVKSLVSLRLVDNAFTQLLPEYQSFVLLKLRSLQRLDDIPPGEAMQMAYKTSDQVKNFNLTSFDALTFNRAKVFHHSDGPADPDEQELESKENQVPRFDEIALIISDALEDPSSVRKATKQLVRMTSKVYELEQSRLDMIFRGMRGKKDSATEAEEIDAAITSFLGNLVVLLEREWDKPNTRVMMYRSLAKLGVVYVHNLGERCIGTLGWLMQRSEEAEEEILSVVKEIVVEPLVTRNILDPITVPTVKGLSKFESPRLPQVLAPISAWLARMYCNFGATPQKDITHLLAVATKDDSNCEAALNFDVGGVPVVGAGPKKEELADHVIGALENKQLANNESLREQYLGHLAIVANTARCTGSRVVEVYEDKQLHKDLMKYCSQFFGDPVEKTAALEDRGNGRMRPKRVGVDLMKLKTLDLRTCAALLDALAGLMERSNDILDELVHTHLPDISIVEFLVIAPKANPVADPVLLSASLRGLRLVLENYSRENAAARKEVLEDIIDDLQQMGPMMEFLEPGSRKYQSLFQKAEQHLADRAEGSTRKPEATYAPFFSGLLNPLMHDCLVSIVDLIKFFTKEGKNDDQCNDVSKRLNKLERERLLFRLLEVPSDDVKSAVMNCIYEVHMGDLTNDEVGCLMKLLEDVTEIGSNEALLEKVIMQLKKMLADDQTGAGAASALRTEFAGLAVESVMNVFVANARRNTYGVKLEEKEKVGLSLACVDFLMTASAERDTKKNGFRANLRSQKVSAGLVEALRQEDLLLSPESPDIMAECTWTGRSIEILLQCLSGMERLKANGKVAFRVIHRIANILEGVEDGEPGEKVSLFNLVDKESAMWDEAKMRNDNFRSRRQLNDPEKMDRDRQQEIFAKFYGIDRIGQFLDGLYGEKEDDAGDTQNKSTVRMQEAMALESAKNFLESAKQVAEGPGSPHMALTDDGRSALGGFGKAGNGDGLLALTDGQSATAPAPVIDFKGQDFNGKKTDFVELRTQHGCNTILGGALSIAFTAKWAQPIPKNCRIIDFGSGSPQDNLVIASQGHSNNLVFSVYVGSSGGQNRLTMPAAILDDGRFHRYLFTVNRKGQMKGYRDGELLADKDSGPEPRSVPRMFMYVGKSNFLGDDLFVGTVKDLKVWNGTALDWDTAANAQDDLEDDGTESIVKPTNKLLVRVFNDLDTNDVRPEKQALRLGTVTAVGAGASIHDSLFMSDVSEGIINAAFLVSAMLRCAFVTLRLPASEAIRQSMMRMLSDRLMVSRILSLVSLCRGPFDCSVASKCLRLLTCVLELPPSQVRAEPERIITYDVVVKYCEKLTGAALMAMKQSLDKTLAARGRSLSLEIVTLLAVMCRAVPCCMANDNPSVQNTLVELALQRLVSMKMLYFIMELTRYDPNSSAGGQAKGVFITDKLVGLLSEQGAVLQSCRKVLSLLLQRCPKMQYPIMECFSTSMVSGTVPLRRSFLSGLVQETASGKERLEFETAMRGILGQNANPPEQLICPPAIPRPLSDEMAIFSAPVEVTKAGMELQVGTSILSSGRAASLVCVITNKTFYIIDTSGGNPQSPDMRFSKRLEDMTRIVKGYINQVVFVGWASQRAFTAVAEDYMQLICHREADRNELLTTLHSVSRPEGGSFMHQVPLQKDLFFASTLMDKITDGIALKTFARNKRGYTRLYVLSSQKLFEYKVNSWAWRPPADKREDEGSGSEDDDESDGDGCSVSMNRRLREAATVASMLDGQGGDDGGCVDAQQIADKRAEIRKKADAERDGEGATYDPRGGSGRGPLLEAPDVDERGKLIDKLSKVHFLPDPMPKMRLDFEMAQKEVATVIIQFFDDMTRESWKRELMRLLKKGSPEAWQRDYKSPGEEQ